MPATGFEIAGMGACLPCLPFSFQNRIFLPDIGFQLLKSLWSSMTYSSFNGVPNVLYR